MSAMADLSPFPGMDPYLEPRWPSVHTRLATYAADMLNTRLPPGLIADVEERTEIVPDDDRATWRRPDAQVTEVDAGGGTAVAARVSAEAPVVLRLIDPEPAVERSVQITGIDGGRVVTAIEFLSPSNKKVPGLADFRRKRAALLRGWASVVEVDLTRGGDWRRLIGRFESAGDARTTFRVSVRLPAEPDKVYLTPIRLQDRLPEIAIPLRPGDPRVTLEFQELFEMVYRAGQYRRRIDYSRPPEPPLRGADAAWAAELLESTPA